MRTRRRLKAPKCPRIFKPYWVACEPTPRACPHPCKSGLATAPPRRGDSVSRPPESGPTCIAAQMAENSPYRSPCHFIMRDSSSATIRISQAAVASLVQRYCRKARTASNTTIPDRISGQKLRTALCRRRGESLKVGRTLRQRRHTSLPACKAREPHRCWNDRHL